jgi:hypothetical protein
MNRSVRIVVAVAVLTLSVLVPSAVRAAPDVCTWGGTALEPTGTATIGPPGLSNAHPAAEPIPFVATGPLAGAGARCTGTMTFNGIFHAGSLCRLFIVSGEISGVDGVKWAFEIGGAYSRSVLYGPDGRPVGSWGPSVIDQNLPDVIAQCNTPEGITAVTFYGTMELIA